MSSGHEGDDELFARAWDDRDTAERHAQPVPRPVDPALAGDLDLAAALRDAGRATSGPSDDARARMRAGLLAEIGGDRAAATPPRGTAHDTRTLRRDTEPRRSPAERSRTRSGSRAGSRPGDDRPAARAEAPRRRTGSRILTNVVSGACAVMLLAALTVLISRGSLPGEMLYPVKRASEGVELGLTNGQEEKGLKHLEFAASRLEEVSGLVGRSATTAAGNGPVAAGLDPSVAALVLANLRSFDEDARNGSRLILPLAQRPAAPSPMDLAGWARSQSSRLDTLSPSLPEDGRVAAADSQAMLQRLSARATSFDGDQPCASGAGSDDLGPLPVDGCTGTQTDTPAAAPAETPATTTTESTSTTTSTTTTTTTTDDDTSSPESRSPAVGGGGGGSGSSEPSRTAEAPAPVQVPLPVPLLPQVNVPPLLPGLPGISLG